MNVPEKPTLENLEAKLIARWEAEGTYTFNRSAQRADVFAIDTPGAMAHIFDAVRRSNIAIDEGNSGQASALSLAVMQMCSALGLELRAAAEVDAATMQRASDLDAARAAKDFATADAIRNELQAAGFVVESTKDGTRVRRA